MTISGRPAPRISATICTHNRADYLDKALKSLSVQTLPAADFEVVVVDNASTDGTASLVESMKPSLPSLRYVFEGSLGLSRARNAAIREARGDYIAFLDDDAVATSRWLESILTAFETVKPTPACVGGRIDPIWEGPRPDWLADTLLGYLTIVNWSEKAMTLDPSRQYVAGANMAFSALALRNLGGFSPSLGRVGDKLLSAEELHVQRMLVAAGHQLHYEPQASVGHHVPAARLTQKWFLNRAYSEGLSTAVMRTVMERLPGHRRALMALHSSIDLLLHPRDWAGTFLRADEAERFASLCRTVRRAGLIWGLLAFSEARP
jgi:glycosyltransferase involved in cell wall biosynthesis